MSYTPKPGSNVEAAIKYIAKKGSGRSADIAAAIGIEAKNIPATLQAAVDNGALVACDIEVPGKQPQKEYRIGGGMAPALLNRPSLAVGAGKKLLRTVEERPAAAAQTPAVKQLSIEGRAVKHHKRLPPGTLRSEILESLNAGVPMSSAQIAKARARQQTKIRDAIVRLVKEGLVLFAKEGRAREYFLTLQGIIAAGKLTVAPAPAPQATPEKSQRSAAKVQRKTAKTANETAKPAGKIAPLVPKQAPIAPSMPFRCGIFSDGALRIDGDFSIDGGGIVIAPAQTCVLVDYLRKLGELEAA